MSSTFSFALEAMFDGAMHCASAKASDDVLGRPSTGTDNVSKSATSAGQDAALVTRVRNSDVDAFTTVFRLYHTVLVRFLRRYFENPSDAEDVAQDTMTLLWERRSTLDPSRSLRALLFTTARNRALDHHRHTRRTVAYANHVRTQAMDADAPTAFAADAEILVDELDHVAAKFIAALPPRQREIFRLSRGEGLSPAEIAELLGITTQTVYVQLGRIAKELYAALDLWT